MMQGKALNTTTFCQFKFKSSSLQNLTKAEEKIPPSLLKLIMCGCYFTFKLSNFPNEYVI